MNIPPKLVHTVLPDELITEILSCLPVKALMRMRCVCKCWKTLISDPNFVKLHLQRSPRKDHHLRYPDFSIIPSSIEDLHNNLCYIGLGRRKCFFVIGSCNGLLCLLNYAFTDAFIDYRLYLWNPAMGLISKEKLASLRVPQPDVMINLSRFAFGHDNIMNTYKLVAFCLNDETNSWNNQVKIFSIGDDNSWRDIPIFPAFPVCLCMTHRGQNDGVYLNNTFNWLAFRSGFNYDSNWRWDAGWNDLAVDQLVIISLDVVSETYKQMLLPGGFDEVPCLEPTVGVLMDCLCFSHDIKRTYFVIWQMKEFGVEQSWIQLLRFSYQEDLKIGFQLGEPYFRLLPLYMSENGDTLMMANEYDHGEVIVYNRIDNKVKLTSVTNPYGMHWDVAKCYVESLVWPWSIPHVTCYEAPHSHHVPNTTWNNLLKWE